MQTTQMTYQTIGEFVSAEMKRMDIKSHREFERQSGISYQVINDMINGKVTTPGIATLVKLSNFTGTSLIALLEICYPDALNIDVDIESRLDAEKLSQLPPNEKTLIRGYIANAYAQSKKK